MPRPVGWCGQLILWHIDAVHVASLHVCPSVLSVSRKGTMRVMILICSEVRQGVLVTVVTHLSWKRQGKLQHNMYYGFSYIKRQAKTFCCCGRWLPDYVQFSIMWLQENELCSCQSQAYLHSTIAMQCICQCTGYNSRYPETQSRVFQQVLVHQVVKKFLTFYRTQSFITAFTGECHRPLSWTR